MIRPCPALTKLLTAASLAALLAGCAGFPSLETNPPDYVALPSPDESPPEEITLPVPDFFIEFYEPLPAPEGDGASAVEPVSLPLATYKGGLTRDEEEVMTTPSPVLQEITPAIPESYVEPETEPDPVVLEPEPEPIKTVTTPEPVPVEAAEETQTEPDRMENVLPGVPAPLVLEGTDWIYLGEEDSRDISFSDRRLLTDRTLFSFLFPEEGTYVLLFLRQDNSTGESEELRIQVNAGPLSDTSTPADTDDMTAEENDISDLPLPLIELQTGSTDSPPRDVLEAEEKLAEIEENPEKAGETIELLEFLMDVASDDEELAGYYYRLARTLEMNSQYQDLRRSYETYQYIEDRFFLTDYYEKARERIRYLDRHFFKLR